jgi:tetratricopeptide (TPR) repeat protein
MKLKPMQQLRPDLLQKALAAHRKGDIGAAERLYLDILRAAPAEFNALHLLGVIRAQQRRFEEAERLIRRAVQVNPMNAEAQNNLGNVLFELGRPREAVPCFRQALSLKPAYPEAHYNLGNALRDSEEPEAAARAFRTAIGIRPDYRDALLNLAALLRQLGQPLEAISNLKRILERRPGDAEAWNLMGHALEEAGRSTEAIAAFDRSLSLAPGSVGAHFDRINIAKVTAEDGLLAGLQALAARAGTLAPRDQAMLHFALGKAEEDLGRYDEAFADLAEGNRVKRGLVAYDEASEIDRMDRVRAVFTDELMQAKAGEGSDSDLPIFVLGFPRSGTTLVEQILASHPQVHGAGELRLVAQLARDLASEAKAEGAYPEAIALLDGAGLRRLGDLYVERLRKLAPGAAHITDKLPGNYVHLGFIRLILPRAKILHVMRDPLDTCISCFCRSFAGELNFAYDLGELGRAYRRYAELMDHWRRVLPAGAMLEVRYEDVVGDLEGQARRILEHCGLPWDPRCLAFHETERTVLTASVSQVRQPIYRSSLARWRRYERHLGPLQAALAGRAAP